MIAARIVRVRTPIALIVLILRRIALIRRTGNEFHVFLMCGVHATGFLDVLDMKMDYASTVISRSGQPNL